MRTRFTPSGLGKGGPAGSQHSLPSPALSCWATVNAQFQEALRGRCVCVRPLNYNLEYGDCALYKTVCMICLSPKATPGEETAWLCRGRITVPAVIATAHFE